MFSFTTVACHYPPFVLVYPPHTFIALLFPTHRFFCSSPPHSLPSCTLLDPHLPSHLPTLHTTRLFPTGLYWFGTLHGSAVLYVRTRCSFGPLGLHYIVVVVVCRWITVTALRSHSQVTRLPPTGHTHTRHTPSHLPPFPTTRWQHTVCLPHRFPPAYLPRFGCTRSRLLPFTPRLVYVTHAGFFTGLPV